MDHDPVRVIAFPLDLAEMDAGPDVQTEVLDLPNGGERAPHSVSGPPEDGEEAVSGRVDLAAAMCFQLTADHASLGGEESRPPLIAEFASELRRADHVGEQDGAQHAG